MNNAPMLKLNSTTLVVLRKRKKATKILS
uniref:Uncharacterized protein n=1 Tax=Rhizophora mucronata TaxID=61149 RepID=A0A2P2R4G3_RHIMU